MRAGDVLIIAPLELVAGGDALAKIDGFPIFAANVFPGDVARVRLYEAKKGFARGELVELLEPSPWRRAAPCPIADECGGCNWTALRLDKQLEAKQRILTESLRRVGKLPLDSLPPIRVHPSALNYRLRSRLHQDGSAAGFYAPRSNRVVPLAAECEVVGVKTARAYGAAAPPSGGGSHDLELWEIGDQIIAGEQELALRVEGHSYQLSTGAFFQVNRHLLGTLLRLVRAHAERVVDRGHAVDLYGGVGFFTAPLAELFARVTMIEGAAGSVAYARRNLPGNVRVLAAPVEREIANMPPAGFTFLDPPRAGARPEVIAAAGAQTKEIIAYLSCDPVTFARDASRLIASGWRLSTLDLLDLFPNTHHVETLSSFERDP